MTRLLSTTIIAALIALSVLAPSAFAQSDFKTIEGNDNPVLQDILEKIEFSKKQYLKSQEKKIVQDEHQKFINEQRIAVQESLNQELERMEKNYEEFTPRNAFAKYVSNLNATNHDIFWDQFDYLQAKISLAKDARDSVLNQGGTYFDAMKKYVEFAKMPKVEMQNIVRELNIKHNLADADIQSNFDVNGKLPRFENDLESPCYGCSAKISKVQINSEQSVPIKRISLEKQPTKINDLRESLSDIQHKFLKSKNVIEQKKMVFEMNKLVKIIQGFE